MEYEQIKKLMEDMGNSKLTDVSIEFPDGVKISMKKDSTNNTIISIMHKIGIIFPFCFSFTSFTIDAIASIIPTKPVIVCNELATLNNGDAFSEISISISCAASESFSINSKYSSGISGACVIIIIEDIT